MRVRIWQQFSSHHSAHFTIVGAFLDPAAAHAAARELRELLRSIVEGREQLVEQALRRAVAEHRLPWYVTLNDAELQQAAASDPAIDMDAVHHHRTAVRAQIWRSHPVSPTEEALAELYGVAWPPRGIDWLPDDADAADRAFQVMGELLLVEPFGSTWTGPAPFAALVARLGGELLVLSETGEGAVGGWLTLRCRAPDAATAAAICRAFKPTPTQQWFAEVDDIALGEGDVRCTECNILFRIRSDWGLRDLPALVASLEARGCTDITFAVAPASPAHDEGA